MPTGNMRIQAPDLPDPQNLRVFGGVNMPSEGVQAPVKDTRLADLASALGSFNTGLSNFGNSYTASLAEKKTKDDDEDKENLKKQRQIEATQTPEEYLKSVPTWATPKAQLAAHITEGQYTATALQKEYQEAIGTGHLRPQDGPAWLQKRREDVLADKGWGTDTGQAHGFGNAYNALLQRAQTGELQAKVGQINDTSRQGAYQQLTMTLDRVQGQDPRAAWDELNKLKTQAQSVFGVDPKDYDQMVFSAIGNRVEKDPNWAVSMAQQPRSDMTTGGPFPALGATPERQGIVQNWQRTALAHNAEIAKAGAESRVGSWALGALLKGDGSFNAIEDKVYVNPVTHAEEKITRSQVQNMAVRRFLAASAQTAQANSETPTQTFNREAEVFIGNDIERPSWKSEIEGAPNLANKVNLTDPGTAKRLVAAAQTYKAIESRSPAYVAAHFDERARTFFNTYSILKDYATRPNGSSWTDVEALNAAANAIKPDAPEERALLHDQIQAVNKKIDSLAAGPSSVSGIPGLRWGAEALFGADITSASNKGQLMGELRRLSTAVARSGGMNGTEAVDVAASYLAKTGSVVNGQWMRKDQIGGLDMGAVGSRVIQQYVDTHGPEFGYGKGDLTLRSAGDGYFTLTDRSGLPVPGGAIMNRGDMLKHQADIIRERDEEILRKQHETAQRNAGRPRQKAYGDVGSDIAEGFKTGSEAVSDFFNPDPQRTIDEVRSGHLVDPESTVGKAVIERQSRRLKERAGVSTEGR